MARRVHRLAAWSIALFAACLVSPRLTRALGILSSGADWIYLFIGLLGASSLTAATTAGLILHQYRAVSSTTKALGVLLVAIQALSRALVVALVYAGPM